MFFGKMGSNMDRRSMFLQPKVVVLGYIFPTSYHTPKMEIVCKSYDPGKLIMKNDVWEIVMKNDVWEIVSVHHEE